MTLEEKRNKIFERINSDIDNTNKQLELLLKQKEVYLKEIEAIKNSKYFSKEEAKEIVEYLVSKVEGKKYTVEKYYMKKIGDSVNIKLIHEYTFLYLVSEDNKDIARKEIENKYTKIDDDDERVINIDVLNDNDISDNYVCLSFYNRYNDRKVEFDNTEEPHVISVDIKDERFNYITDFMNEVISAKLDRGSFSIPMKGIKVMADNYALKQKQNKKLVLESE